MTHEPTDVGPAVGGDLPATDTDKQHVITLLDAARDEGRITAPEHTARVTRAQQAVVFDDLVPLTRDITGSARTTAYATPTSPAADYRPVVVDPAGAEADSETLVGILGGSNRRGTWRVRKKINAICFLGGHELDLSEAIFDSPRTEINVSAFLGGVEVRIPPGIRVINQTVAILGGSEIKYGQSTDPNDPVIVFTGFLILGGLEVKGPRKSISKTLKEIADLTNNINLKD